MENILLEGCIKYANDVIEGKEITTKEVKEQCEIFIKDYNKRQYEEEFEFYFDEKECFKINNLLKLFNFATGFVAGKQILENLAPFQAFFIANIFGWRYKNKQYKFRYNDITLFIARKNAKTAIVAVIFLLLLLTQQKFSEFYSICLTKELASEIKKIMEQIINASTLIKKHFKVSVTKCGRITCKLTGSFFEPRVAEAGKNNAIRSEAFVSDEHANFNESSNFNAMKSGQKNVMNGLVFRTTTAYEIDNSIMQEDLEYIGKVLKGEIQDERQFALIYYATEEHLWDDIGIYMANPLRIEENYDTMRKDRKIALEKESMKSEYLTKTMNVFINEKKGEKYIEFESWKKCEVEKVDLKEKKVIVGVDASLTTDLTAVDIMYQENGCYFLKSHAFLPENTLKDRREKIDYRQMERLGYCTITKGDIVDYNVLEDYIRSIESKYECTIEKIVSDPFNITATMQKLSEDFEVILLRQSYSVLSPPIKQFRDDVYKGIVKYEKNSLLDWCMSNTTTVLGRTTGDILLNKVNKNKTRIDMVVAAIFGYSQLYIRENKLELTEEYLNKFFKRE